MQENLISRTNIASIFSKYDREYLEIPDGNIFIYSLLTISFRLEIIYDAKLFRSLIKFVDYN